ncbi:egg cell-secreted protein 1.2 [Coffea arabica]|uniref:Egg cell-secreted protein 1.2 n=1 Tax=Coffea arabica TaxID=13443 RepID=A0A6P6TFP3_COFAR
MALNSVKLLFLVITCFMVISCSSSARKILPRNLSGSDDQSISKLNSRLETNNGSVLECWNALSEIKSCTDEIAAYFTNGTTDIGPGCCHAIIVITHNCWPTILSALGFSADQTYILRGYCDASLSSFGPAQAPSA